MRTSPPRLVGIGTLRPMVACLRCGVELGETDRYCPYCRAPAPSARHNPTWAPEDRTSAAVDHVAQGESAVDGERCPRCDRHVTPGDGFCASCGMALEDPAARAGWEPPEPGAPWPTGWGSEFPVWPGRTTDEVPAFVDAATYGRAVRGATAILAGVAFAGMAAAIAWERSLDHLARTGSASAADRAALAESWLGALDRVGLLVALVAIGLFALWSTHAYRNLPALGARGLRWAPTEVLASWIVPIVNLHRPLLVLSDLWRGADPDRELHPSVSWRSAPVPLALRVWWATAVVTPFLLVGTSLLVEPSAVSIDDRDRVAVLRMAVHGIELLTAALAFGLVGDLTRRQRRRADAIGWPALRGYRIPAPGERSVPVPDVDAAGAELVRPATTTASADVAGKY